MTVRLTTLCENTAGRPEMRAEWGLSLLIEADDHTVLMDSGAGTAALTNAGQLGVDLTRIDTVVLSHGHRDHTGGLAALLPAIGHSVRVIAHPDVFNPRWNHTPGRAERAVGLPAARGELESLGARFELSRAPVNLSDRIMTSGEIRMTTDFEFIDPALVLKSEAGWVADPLLDDLSLFITTSRGLVVALGCAHRGMINILRQAREITGVSKIRLVVGGSHLKDASPEQVWQAVSALNEMGVQKLAVCHCTGMPATLLLAQAYGRDFIFNPAGSVLRLND